jgi:N-acetylglucosamine kinase-like BadF-type ATPase
MTATVLAVDGGNSKTELALARVDGTVLGVARGPGSNQHRVGIDGTVAIVAKLWEQASAEAGVHELPRHAVYVLAGADLPEEEMALENALAAQRWSQTCRVRNDTIAVLRSGSERGWGVAVVCGAGINARGVAPDGREERFPALGPISGDWGGGGDLGLGALSAASRAEDGRGPATVLHDTVPAYFGLGRPSDVSGAIYRKELSQSRLVELAPVVLAGADAGDEVAASLVDRLATEIVDFVRATLHRLDVGAEPVDVVLGGGLMHARHARLDAAIDSGVRAVAPHAVLCRPDTPPIAGALLLALDHTGDATTAAPTLRQQFGDDAWRAARPAPDVATAAVSHG